IPAHATNESSIVESAVTDYMFVNNDRAGGIMHFPTDFGQTDHFGVVQRDISKITRNIPFGLMALAGHAPSNQHTSYDIEFTDTSPVPVHNDGEFALLDISRLSIRKDQAVHYTAVRPRS